MGLFGGSCLMYGLGFSSGLLDFRGLAFKWLIRGLRFQGLGYFMFPCGALLFLRGKVPCILKGLRLVPRRLYLKSLPLNVPLNR